VQPTKKVKRKQKKKNAHVPIFSLAIEHKKVFFALRNNSMLPALLTHYSRWRKYKALDVSILVFFSTNSRERVRFQTFI